MKKKSKGIRKPKPITGSRSVTTKSVATGSRGMGKGNMGFIRKSQ